MTPASTRRPAAPETAFRRTAAVWVGLVLLLQAGAALASGLASWASRPEAWTLGFALPARGAVAWVGIAGPVLGPTAAAVGAFLVARRLGRSGELDAWRGLGVGGAAQWRALAPVWGGLALVALVSAWWVEPAAWTHMIELQEAARGPGLNGPTSVSLGDGGVALFDREGALRLRTGGGVEAYVRSLRRDGPSRVRAGALSVRTRTGTWVARGARLSHREPVVETRRLPPIASTGAELHRTSLFGDVVARRRATAVLHRRAGSPFLLLALSAVGWSLGTAAGVGRRSRDLLPIVGLVVLLLVVLGGARVADRSVPLSSLPAWLFGWAPVLLAGVALGLVGLGSRARSR